MAGRVFSVRCLQPPGKGPVLPLLRRPKSDTASLSTHSCETFPSPASFVAAIYSARRLAYPVGEDSAVILHSLAPNSRRGRGLSAHRSQEYRVGLISRPPVSTKRCGKLLSDQLPLRCGNTNCRHKFPKL